MTDAATRELAAILADWQIRYNKAKPDAVEIVQALAVRGYTLAAAGSAPERDAEPVAWRIERPGQPTFFTDSATEFDIAEDRKRGYTVTELFAEPVHPGAVELGDDEIEEVLTAGFVAHTYLDAEGDRLIQDETAVDSLARMLVPTVRALVQRNAVEANGSSREKCVRCGWVMGMAPLNCMNNDTPHRFPSQIGSTVNAFESAVREAWERSTDWATFGREVQELIQASPVTPAEGAPLVQRSVRDAVQIPPAVTDAMVEAGASAGYADELAYRKASYEATYKTWEELDEDGRARHRAVAWTVVTAALSAALAHQAEEQDGEAVRREAWDKLCAASKTMLDSDRDLAFEVLSPYIGRATSTAEAHPAVEQDSAVAEELGRIYGVIDSLPCNEFGEAHSVAVQAAYATVSSHLDRRIREIQGDRKVEWCEACQHHYLTAPPAPAVNQERDS